LEFTYRKYVKRKGYVYNKWSDTYLC
jgi:hypothetical protein